LRHSAGSAGDPVLGDGRSLTGSRLAATGRRAGRICGRLLRLRGCVAGHERGDKLPDLAKMSPGCIPDARGNSRHRRQPEQLATTAGLATHTVSLASSTHGLSAHPLVMPGAGPKIIVITSDAYG